VVSGQYLSSMCESNEKTKEAANRNRTP